MSDQPARFSSTRAALRTRVLMVGLFLGALLAMSVSWVFALGPESEQVKAEREAQRIVAAREAAFRSPPGSCLTWTKPDASDVSKVSCDKEHLFEVVGAADISDEYGPKAKAPDIEGWRELTEERCGTIAEEYLPKPLDPFGKLTIGVLRPDAKQWAQGDRTLHCGLQWAGPGGGLQKLDKPAAEINQSNVWEPGTCLALVGKTVGDPISCSAKHSYEIIGLVDLAKEFDDFPPPDKQMEWLDPTCSKLAKEYTGGKDLGKDGLILSWDVREKESWEAGSTLVNCKVGAVLPDDSGLAAVRGSVKKSEQPPKDDKSKDGKDKPDADGQDDKAPEEGGSDNQDGGNQDGGSQDSGSQDGSQAPTSESQDPEGG